MLLTSRSIRRQIRLRNVLAVLLFWALIDVLTIRARLSRVDSTKDLLVPHIQRIYIAALHWNNEQILRSHWNAAVIELVKTLGPENVFISIYESGSWDNSKVALRELDSQLEILGVPRSITLDEKTHADEISGAPTNKGWIETPSGKTELRRIPYLAKLRNLTLRPLQELHKQGQTFDRILFLGDVVFTPDDVLRLLNTNNGSYAAVCSLDFSKPPNYYDTFALRDFKGHSHIMPSWPFFQSRKSRQAMEKLLPVPVASCWNGIVAMVADPFTTEPPLGFRGISDSLARSYLEASECCLIHADNPLSYSKGVYLNPNVRVGYSEPAYTAVNPLRNWLSLRGAFWATWENRLRRWLSTPFLEHSAVRRKLRTWASKADSNREPGGFCLIDETQVLVWNGWAHV